EQRREIATQAAWLARQPNADIKDIVRKMLTADQEGTKPPLDLAGFIRCEEAYDGSRTEVAADAPDRCDQCGRDLIEAGYYLDGCTTRDLMWSWMCPPCFFRVGCG